MGEKWVSCFLLGEGDNHEIPFKQAHRVYATS
jgi:hypothetical protein